MHTVIVLGIGFVLFFVCILIGRFAGGSKGTMRKAALAFIPLWLVGAAINMAIGVWSAGYPMKDEFPIFLLVFSAPAFFAMIFWWRSWQASKA